MARALDITNQRFGRLVALKRVGKDKFRLSIWACQCDCGNIKEVRVSDLKKGYVLSCGCLHKENTSKINFKHGHARVGKIRPEHRIWSLMIDRCTNSNNKYYEHYGGRGIKVCERWKDYNNFYADMGDRPSPKHTLERIDVNGDYEPSNCKWATIDEQAINKRVYKNSNSGVRGVSWSNDKNRWIATISVNKKTIYLGSFVNKDDAIKARKEAEKKYWGN